MSDRAMAPPERPQAIFVIGMHRSGTSALARLINLLGVYLSDDLLPPAADNEAGFWEHRTIVQIQERLLQSLGHSWFSATALPPRWWELPEVVPFRDELAAVVGRDFADAPVWGLKDPRLCFTLPLWQQVLGETCDLKCLLIVRHPTEVVRSLGKRDAMRESRGYMLWLRSLIAAEQDSRKLPRCLVRYETLLNDWSAAMRRVGDDLCLQWPVGIEAATPAAADFLRPSLRHHTVSDQQLFVDPAVPPLVGDAYTAAVRASETGSWEVLSIALDAIRETLDDPANPWAGFTTDLEQDYGREVNTSHELNRQRLAMIDTLQSNVATTQAVAEHHQRETASRTAELVEASARADDLREQALNLQRRLAMSEQHAAELTEHAANLQAIRLAAEQREADLAAAMAEQRRASDVAIEDKERHIVNITAMLNKTAASLEATTAARDALQVDRDAARTLVAAYQLDQQILLDLVRQTTRSRSWRLTAPLRALGRQRLTRDRLVPHSAMVPMGEHRWKTVGAAQFLLPCHPIVGPFRVRLSIESDAGSEALLFYDTGRLFNDQQLLRIGPVTPGVSTLEARGSSHEPIYCFRFDPVQSEAVFTIEGFEILIG